MMDDRLASARNTDLQSVWPAEFHSAEPETAENISAGRTGHGPVFRSNNSGRPYA
jgi:hypothetical protein